jgi:hypothetical protein
MASNISNTLSAVLNILEVSTDNKKNYSFRNINQKVTNTTSFLSVHPSDIIEQPVFFFFILACTPQASSLFDPLLASNISL